MTLNPISISPDASVDEAASVMEAHRVSALPVMEKSRVVGILTTTDVLRAFVALSGAAEPTTRIIVSSKGGSGIENQVRRIVHACHGELKWIHGQGRNLHLRVKARHVDEIVTALEGAGLDVTAVVSSHAVNMGRRKRTSSATRASRIESRPRQ
jgi:CBS domain-containing protein